MGLQNGCQQFQLNYNYEIVRAQQVELGGPQPSRGNHYVELADNHQQKQDYDIQQRSQFWVQKEPFNLNQNQMNQNKQKLETNPEEQFKEKKKLILQFNRVLWLNQESIYHLEKAKRGIQKGKEIKKIKKHKIYQNHSHRSQLLCSLTEAVVQMLIDFIQMHQQNIKKSSNVNITHKLKVQELIWETYILNKRNMSLSLTCTNWLWI